MSHIRDIEFLFELGSLRHIQRGWRQHLATNCANDLEHTIRVAWLAMILARKEGIKNEEKILKMALVHDISETRTSDHSYIQKVYVDADERRAAEDLFNETSVSDLQETLAEYEKRESPEAKVVKDADNLDVDLELKELEERGHQLPKKWRMFRQKIRNEKLYTNAAKELWDVLQTVDPASWHLTANKWLKIPKAGL